VVVREEQHRTIGRRSLEGLRGDLATGTCLVVHNHVGAQQVLEFVAEQACNGVGATARGEAHHQLDGGVGVRAGQTQGQRGQGAEQMAAGGAKGRQHAGTPKIKQPWNLALSARQAKTRIPRLQQMGASAEPVHHERQGH